VSVAGPDDGDFGVVVTAVRAVAEDTLEFELRAVDGRPLPPWEPGAHLDLTLPSGAVRQYSLCGDPADRARYRIAVLREAGGRGGSAELHDVQVCGRTLTTHLPRNHFPLERGERYLFVAGGIGITAILPMVREAAAQNIPWELVFGARTLSRMAYLDELAALPGGTLSLRPEDESGRLGLEALLDGVTPATLVYACGPAGLLDALEELAAKLGRPGPRVERFAASPDAVTGPLEGDRPVVLHLARSGLSITVPADRSLLAAIRDVRPDVPYSCEEGFCGACETRVLGGVPDHRDEVLSEADRAANTTMMVCVSRALSAPLTLDV
jgi:ferredoxin-NADP reductase